VTRSEGGGRARDAQKRADAELPLLLADVRQGRYVEAIARGNRVLGLGELARAQVAQVNRWLTEAYVALDATGLAEAACAAWREADPSADLDPIELSPKILNACTSSHSPPPRAEPADAGADAAANDAGKPARRGA